MQLINKLEQLSEYIDSEKQLYLIENGNIYRIVIIEPVDKGFRVFIIKNGIHITSPVLDSSFFEKNFLLETDSFTEEIKGLLLHQHEKLFLKSKNWKNENNKNS